MLTVAIPKRNKLQNIIVLTPKDGKYAKSERKIVQYNGQALVDKFLSQEV